MSMEENLFEAFDEWVENIGNEIFEDESRTMMLDPVKLEQMRFTYAVLKKYAETNGATVSCKFNEPFPSMGSVSIEGEDFIFQNPKWFARAAECASNVEIYPLANGGIRITYTFHGYAKPIE